MPEARPGTWKVQPGMSVAGAFRSWAVRPCLERLVFFLQLGVGLCVGGTAIDRRSCQRLYAGGLRCQFAKGRICEVKLAICFPKTSYYCGLCPEHSSSGEVD